LNPKVSVRTGRSSGLRWSGDGFGRGASPGFGDEGGLGRASAGVSGLVRVLGW